MWSCKKKSEFCLFVSKMYLVLHSSPSNSQQSKDIWTSFSQIFRFRHSQISKSIILLIDLEYYKIHLRGCPLITSALQRGRGGCEMLMDTDGRGRGVFWLLMSAFAAPKLGHNVLISIRYLYVKLSNWIDTIDSCLLSFSILWSKLGVHWLQ